MQRPDKKATRDEWQQWADANYPYDGSKPFCRDGFDILRATEDRELAADMAQMLARALPDKSPPMNPAPSMPDRRLPPEREYDGLFGDEL